MTVTRVNFVPMDPDNLEYRLSPEEYTPENSDKQFKIISSQEAYNLYFTRQEEMLAKLPILKILNYVSPNLFHKFLKYLDGKTNVYVILGGQKGDEGKGMAAKLVEQSDPNIAWTMAPNSTHNAGKGVHTNNENGEDVKVSLHLSPATLVDPGISNYISLNAQVNPFSLYREILDMQIKTGRDLLGEDYHLMVDSKANLVIPTNRADDIVGKKNAMGSTVVGATASASAAIGKIAPILEHVLYNPELFLKKVNYQIGGFEDRIKRDKEFTDLGITDMSTLGAALFDKSIYSKNRRLETLANKLSEPEKQFFIESDPAKYLLEQYKAVCDKGLFYIGDCKKEINDFIAKGIPGILELVQSAILSGPVKYSDSNRTSAGTNSAASIGDACLIPEPIKYVRLGVYKFGHTSVGGNERTMSGFIEQDALYKLAVEKDGQMVSFEKTESLDLFLTKDQINQAFKEVNDAFYKAIEHGDSLRNSKVRVEGIDMDFSLAEARALFTAYKWNEKGETSGRARICRLDDLVEQGYAQGFEGHPLQIRNAVDRGMDQPWIGVITAYEVVAPYGEYKIGDIIWPGMPLLQEDMTVKACIPIISKMPAWESIAADGTNDLRVGQKLDRNLSNYLKRVSQGGKIFAIGAGPKLDDKVYVK
jgi:adenylosuccinate synthase